MTKENTKTEFSTRIQDLLDDTSVSNEEKIRNLEDMRLDLVERQRATEESMGAKVAQESGEIGDQLQRVTEALATLRGSDADPG
ncbi:MAG TPA: hypothetical protein VK854_10135 [Woeseiaceae bacterium]|nr:hypothetical protein [Woeseiaceae bacterium]